MNTLIDLNSKQILFCKFTMKHYIKKKFLNNLNFHFLPHIHKYIGIPNMFDGNVIELNLQFI
jgi:hypothetical protein